MLDDQELQALWQWRQRIVDDLDRMIVVCDHLEDAIDPAIGAYDEAHTRLLVATLEDILEALAAEAHGSDSRNPLQ